MKRALVERVCAESVVAQSRRAVGSVASRVARRVRAGGSASALRNETKRNLRPLGPRD